MGNATQIAKAEGRIQDVKLVYADLCNTVAEGSGSWTERRLARGEESVRLFVEQCCTVSDIPQRSVPVPVLYAAYVSWCGGAEGGYIPVRQNIFEALLRKFAPDIRINRPRSGSPKHRPRFVSGLTLNSNSVML